MGSYSMPTRRIVALLLFFVSACWQSRPPRPAKRVVPIEVGASAPSSLPESDPSLPKQPAEVVLASWRARVSQGSPFPRVADRLADMLPGAPEGKPLIFARRSEDGALIAFGVEVGVVILDGKTGEPRGFFAQPKTFSVEIVPGTHIVAISAESGSHSLIDADTMTVLLRFATQNSIALGRQRIAYLGTTAAHVWDATIRRVIRSVPIDPDFPSWEVTLSRDGSVLTVRGDPHTSYDVDSGVSIGRFGGVFTPGPERSGNGRWAVVSDESFDAAGNRASETWLVDLETKKTVARSHACDFPTEHAFSDDGKLVAVGDLRRACVLRVPQLTLVARTGFVRKQGFIDDDLQDISGLWFSDSGRRLAMTTSDGSFGLFRVKTGRSVFLGRGRPVFSLTSSDILLVDPNENRLITLDDGFQKAARTLSEDESYGNAPIPEIPVGADFDNDNARANEMARRQVCHVGPWLLPKSDC